MITIGYSTKKIDENYLHHVKDTTKYENQIIAFQNNNEISLTRFYNKIIKESKNDIIVLCHDDLVFETFDWDEIVIDLFKENPHGIIGVAGAKLLSESGVWWEHCNPMYGIVNQIIDGEKVEHKWSHYNENLENMVVIDGLFIALNKNRIKKYFDEDIKGFHYYDLDFSLSNFLENVKIGLTTKIRLTHFSNGTINDSWYENKDFFTNKYKNELPIDVREYKVELLPSQGPFCPDKNF